MPYVMKEEKLAWNFGHARESPCFFVVFGIGERLFWRTALPLVEEHSVSSAKPVAPA